MKKILTVLLGFSVICFLYTSCKEISDSQYVLEEEISTVEVMNYEEEVEETIVEEKPKDIGHNTLKEICTYFNDLGDYRYDLTKFHYFDRFSIDDTDVLYDAWENNDFEYEDDTVYICIDADTHSKAYIQFKEYSYPIQIWENNEYISYFETLKGFWKTKDDEYLNVREIDEDGNYVLDIYLPGDYGYNCFKSLTGSFKKTSASDVPYIMGSSYHTYYNGTYNNDLISLLIFIKPTDNSIGIASGVTNHMIVTATLEFKEHLSYVPSIDSYDIEVYQTDIIYELSDGYVASNKEYIRDISGNILGSLEHYDNGDIFARDPKGVLIGRYLKMSDVTLDGNGKIVYKGNYVQMLIK